MATTTTTSVELQTIESCDLDAVTGGGLFATLGQGALAGALEGAAQGLKTGGFGNGNVLKGLLSGALTGAANTGASLIQGAGQQPAAQPQQ